MKLFAAALLIAIGLPQNPAPLDGSRAPAYSADGRLAVSIDGDLYIQESPGGGSWRRVTTGAAWDRDPAWARNGRSIVFSSNRGGAFSLWQIEFGAGSEPVTRLTNSREDDSAPSVAADGSIAFVRGFGGAARVWIRNADGTERRLTNREQAELAPAFSPDGNHVAYIQVFETGRRLLVRTLANGRDGIVSGDRSPEKLAWAPDGSRIAFSTTGVGGRAGVYVAAANASYVNFVGSHRGDLAWSPDGKTLAVAEFDEGGPGYNGDPARLGDRAVRDPFGTRATLALVAAPVAPDADRRVAEVTAPRDLPTRNADVLDQVWQRSTNLYLADATAAQRRAKWESVRDKYRTQAASAKDDDELQRVIHRMLKERPPLREPATGRAAVSSAHPVATEAGLEIFRAGGNAVDAAAAVSFTLGVVEPDASGVGGYGQMVIALQRLEKPALIDFMTRVPEDAGLGNTSLLVNGRYPSDGPVLANVPGTVAGMYSAFRQYGSGKVTWKDIVAPAIRAAKNGYIVSDGLATTLSTEREHFVKYEGSRKLFFRDGKPLVAGDTVKNPDLAWVLEQIAERGADGFYRGAVAQRLVDDMRKGGNAMKLTDLSRFFAADREPVRGMYRGYTLWSSAPPVSGGADLVGKFNLLEQFGTMRPYTDDARTLHAALASWTMVPRGQVADPAFWPVNITSMISKDSAKVRWSCFRADRVVRATDLRADTLGCAPAPRADDSGDAFELGSSVRPTLDKITESAELGCGEDHAVEVSFCHAAGTTAFVVADNQGNAVSVTQTLGTWGGNFYVSPGLGFLYNDKLLSYGTDPSAYGARLPFARHGSTLAPTVVMRGKRPVFAVGAAGNAWITSAVYQALIGLMDFGLDPQEALELPRFLPGGRGGGGAFNPTEAPLFTAEPGATGGVGGRGAGGRGAPPAAAGRGGASGPVAIQIEDGFSPDVLKRMREMGYTFDFVSFKGELREGYGAAIAIDGRRVTAGADPRRAGTAGAVP
ncbi:MAG: gamma-glutamyltransferase [Gemmatimonadota bacterium]|nr:gamma-glutamyltransferase [Gemmatimonadota bacterium]